MHTQHRTFIYLSYIVFIFMLLAYGRAAGAWMGYQTAPHSIPVAYAPGPATAFSRGHNLAPRATYLRPPWPAQRAATQWQPPTAPVPASPVATAQQTTAAAATDLPDTPADAGSSGSDNKKQRFIETLLPLVRAENTRLARTRQRALGLLEIHADPQRKVGESDARWLRELANTYRIDADPLEDSAAAAALANKVDIIPTGLAIAQAANESAWGNSRFAREGNNLFGIWTYDPAKGIKPKNRAAGKTHLVRVYDDIGESVRSYMHNLNSHPAYQALRAERARLRADGKPLNAIVLAGGLSKYSELGEEYVERIRAMIRSNELERYDQNPLTTASLGY